jgi:hypothetical protein
LDERVASLLAGDRGAVLHLRVVREITIGPPSAGLEDVPDWVDVDREEPLWWRTPDAGAAPPHALLIIPPCCDLLPSPLISCVAGLEEAIPVPTQIRDTLEHAGRALGVEE